MTKEEIEIKLKGFYSKRLQEILVQKNISSKEIAELIGVSHRTVLSWFKDEKIPSVKYILKTLDVFHMSLADFFAPIMNEMKSNKKEEKNKDNNQK